jgi:hypothetical protein
MPTPRCMSSRTETFEDYVYWFVETNQGKANIKVDLLHQF